MKALNNYITEKLHINKDVKDPYNYHPKTIDELVNIIQEKIDNEGLGTKDNPLNLNDIDTSKIEDMSHLFSAISSGRLKELSLNGYFNISDWDVSNVENMTGMFFKSNFNGDLSKWNVESVKEMHMMFAWSKFNGNISDWNVSNVKVMDKMFYECPIEKNPPKWYHENN